MTGLAVKSPIENNQVDSQWISRLLPESIKITIHARVFLFLNEQA